MSAMVKLAKDPLEPCDIDQPTAECHLMVWPQKRKLVTRRDELRPRRWSRRHRGACPGVEDEAFQEKDGYMDEPRSVKDGAEDTDERVMTSHTEGCEVTSVEEGHDVERATAQNDEIVGSLKQLKGETSADLTALEKKGLDRKTNHQHLMKAETQPRSARPPPCRDKSHNRGESMLWLASTYMEHEATIEGVKKYHLCLSSAINSMWEALNVKALPPDKFMDESDVQVSDDDA